METKLKQSHDALEKEVQDALAWARDVQGIKDTMRLGAYEAGIRQGWNNRGAFEEGWDRR